MEEQKYLGPQKRYMNYQSKKQNNINIKRGVSIEEKQHFIKKNLPYYSISFDKKEENLFTTNLSSESNEIQDGQQYFINTFYPILFNNLENNTRNKIKLENIEEIKTFGNITIYETQNIKNLYLDKKGVQKNGKDLEDWHQYLDIIEKYKELYSFPKTPTLKELVAINRDYFYKLGIEEKEGEEMFKHIIPEKSVIDWEVLYKVLEERKDGLKKCYEGSLQNKNKSYELEKILEKSQIKAVGEDIEFYKKEYKNEKKIFDKLYNIEGYEKKCKMIISRIKWGKYDLLNNVSCNINNNEKLHLNLVNRNHKQYIFGQWDPNNPNNPIEYLTKNCKKKFKGGLLMPLSVKKKTCGPYVQWTRKTNDLYTICAGLQNSVFPLRFYLHDGQIIPHKYTYVSYKHTSASVCELYTKKLLSIIEISYINSSNLKRYLYLFITYDNLEKYIPSEKYTYIDWIDGTFTKFKTFDYMGARSYGSSIFRYKNITYTEFNLLYYWLKMNIYESKHNPSLLFFSYYNLTNTDLEYNGLKRCWYETYEIQGKIKHIVKIVKINKENFIYIAFLLSGKKFSNNKNFKVIENKQKLYVYIRLSDLLKKSGICDHILSSNRLNREILEGMNNFKEPLIEIVILQNEKLTLYELVYSVKFFQVPLILNILKRNNTHHYIYEVLEKKEQNEYYLFLENSPIPNIYINNLKLRQIIHGGSNLLISSKFQNKFKIQCNLNISTNFFNIFADKELFYYNLFFNKKINDYLWNNLKKFTDNIYSYNYLLCSNHIIEFNYSKIVKKKSSSGIVKSIKVNDLFKDNCSTPITKYHPFTNAFYNILEIVNKHEIIPNKKTKNKIRILEIANDPSLFETLNYFCKKSKKIDYNLFYMMKYNYGKYIQPSLDLLNHYTQYLPVKSIIKNNYIDEKFMKLNEKFNLIYWSLSISSSKIQFDEIENIRIFFFGLLFILMNLEKGGNAVLNVKQITTKPMADIIVIGKKYFKECILFHPKIHNKIKRSGSVAIFKDFQGIPEKELKSLYKIFQELIKYDPTGIRFNLKNKKNREKYKYTKELTNENEKFDYKYINGFLDLDSKNSQYDFIRKFNEKRYWEQIQFVEKLIELKEMGDDTSEQKAKIAEYRKEQLISSILWAKEFDMKVVPFVEKGDFKDDFGKMVLRDMFSYHKCIDLTFRKSKTIEQKMIPIPDEFWKLANKFNMALFMIDTRDISLWDDIKHKIRYYKAGRGKHQGQGVQLMDHLVDNFDIGSDKLSQAWIKIYEMHQLYSLVSKNKKEIKTFHFCEAPGNFIKATEYFIKTKSKNKKETKLKWMAQSLNPKNKKNIKKYGNNIFGDKYNLLKKNPDKWNWGADGTGDILNPENIKYYKKYCEGVELITSDCGLGWKEDDDSLLKIDIAQILAILYNLPKGANFVGKFVLPIRSPLLVSLIYILYESFGKLIFYKSIQNQYSGEFYIIGKKYKPVDKEVLDKLLKLLKVKNNNVIVNTDLDLYKTYPEEFIYQLINIIDKMVDNLTFHIDRQLYYVDNMKFISEEHIDLLRKYIVEKNKDWVKRFKFK